MRSVKCFEAAALSLPAAASLICCLLTSRGKCLYFSELPLCHVSRCWCAKINLGHWNPLLKVGDFFWWLRGNNSTLPSQSKFLFTLGGSHPQSGKQQAHFDPSRGSPFVLPENIWGRFPRVFGDKFGEEFCDKFGDEFSESPNLVMN